MHWVKLPSGKYVNLDGLVAVGVPTTLGLDLEGAGHTLRVEGDDVTAILEALDGLVAPPAGASVVKTSSEYEDEPEEEEDEPEEHTRTGKKKR